jgi:hypothetical protein
VTGARFDGVVASRAVDGLDLRLRNEARQLFVPFDVMQSLAVLRGEQHSRGRGAVKGLLIGAAVGIMGGYIAGNTSTDHYTCGGGCGEEGAVILGVGLGLVGLGVGAILGSTSGRWVSVPVG